MFIISIVLSLFNKMDNYGLGKKVDLFFILNLVFQMLFEHLGHDLSIGDQMPLYKFLKELIDKMSNIKYNKLGMNSSGQIIFCEFNYRIFTIAGLFDHSHYDENTLSFLTIILFESHIYLLIKFFDTVNFSGKSEDIKPAIDRITQFAAATKADEAAEAAKAVVRAAKQLEKSNLEHKREQDALAVLKRKKDELDALNLEKKNSGQGQTPAELVKKRDARKIVKRAAKAKAAATPARADARAAKAKAAAEAAAERAAKRAAELADERAHPGRAAAIAADAKAAFEARAAAEAKAAAEANAADKAAAKAKAAVEAAVEAKYLIEHAERKLESDKLAVDEQKRVAAELANLKVENPTHDAFCAAIIKNATRIWKNVDPKTLHSLWGRYY